MKIDAYNAYTSQSHRQTNTQKFSSLFSPLDQVNVVLFLVYTSLFLVVASVFVSFCYFRFSRFFLVDCYRRFNHFYFFLVSLLLHQVCFVVTEGERNNRTTEGDTVTISMFVINAFSGFGVSQSVSLSPFCFFLS